MNPGIFLVNAGANFDLTPKLKSFLNVNYLRFERTAPIALLLFESREGKLIQRSMMDPHLEWEAVQTLDSITPGNPHYSEKSRVAKTLRMDGMT